MSNLGCMQSQNATLELWVAQVNGNSVPLITPEASDHTLTDGYMYIPDVGYSTVGGVPESTINKGSIVSPLALAPGNYARN